MKRIETPVLLRACVLVVAAGEAVAVAAVVVVAEEKVLGINRPDTYCGGVVIALDPRSLGLSRIKKQARNKVPKGLGFIVYGQGFRKSWNVKVRVSSEMKSIPYAGNRSSAQRRCGASGSSTVVTVVATAIRPPLPLSCR